MWCRRLLSHRRVLGVIVTVVAILTSALIGWTVRDDVLVLLRSGAGVEAQSVTRKFGGGIPVEGHLASESRGNAEGQPPKTSIDSPDGLLVQEEVGGGGGREPIFGDPNALIEEWHQAAGSRFHAALDSPSGAALGSRRAAASSTVPIYPPSIAAYRHPFGSCRSGRRLKLNYSHYSVGDPSPLSTNFTRVWPSLPDWRVVQGGDSEHERCHFVMARMLGILASVLRHHNMTTWFITHATLLGAVREGGFIPWDVDVDIAMPRSHLTFLRRRWRREFPRDMFLQSEKTDQAFHMWNGKERAIRVKDRYSNFPGMRFSLQKGRKVYRQRKMHMGAHVDIIPLERVKGRYKILHSFFDPDDIFPLSTVCFENMDLPAPRNITRFLSTLYGSSFMTRPSDAAFGGPTVLPCFATQRMRGNPWSLQWATDMEQQPSKRSGTGGSNHSLRKRWPRDDPDHGTYQSDFKTPHRLYYNSKW